MKTCIQCSTPKETSEFSPHRSSKDGLRNRCIQCCTEKNNAKYDTPEDFILKQCSQCQEQKPRREFYNVAATKDGKNPACKKCCERSRRVNEAITDPSSRESAQRAVAADKSLVLLAVQLRREQMDFLDYAIEQLNRGRVQGDLLTRADVTRYALDRYLTQTFY